MKSLIPFLLLTLVGCSSFPEEFMNKVESMPAVKNKVINIENTCRQDIAGGKLNVKFATQKIESDFCTCLILGLGEFTQFAPVTKEFAVWTESEFDRSPEQYIINFSEKLQKHYFDLIVTIQNSNKNQSWKDRFEKLYMKNVSYCATNARYAIDY